MDLHREMPTFIKARYLETLFVCWRIFQNFGLFPEVAFPVHFGFFPSKTISRCLKCQNHAKLM